MRRMERERERDLQLSLRFLAVLCGAAICLSVLALNESRKHRSEGSTERSRCQKVDQTLPAAQPPFDASSQPALVLDRVPAERVHLTPTHGISP